MGEKTKGRENDWKCSISLLSFFLKKNSSEPLAYEMVTPTFKAGLPCLVIPRNSLTHILRCALFILYVLLNPILLAIKFSFQRSKGAGESRRCPNSWLECHLLKLVKEQLKRWLCACWVWDVPETYRHGNKVKKGNKETLSFYYLMNLPPYTQSRKRMVTTGFRAKLESWVTYLYSPWILDV